MKEYGRRETIARSRRERAQADGNRADETETYGSGAGRRQTEMGGMGRAQTERSRGERMQAERSRRERPQAEGMRGESVRSERRRRERSQAEGMRGGRAGVEGRHGEGEQAERSRRERSQAERVYGESAQGERIRRERRDGALRVESVSAGRSRGEGRAGGNIPPKRRRRNNMSRLRRRAAMFSTWVCTILLLAGGIHFVRTSQWFGTFRTAGQGGNQAREVLGPPISEMSNDILERQEDFLHEKPLIVIDPGHGGTDTGCDRAGIMESEINMQIANRLSGKLKEQGYETLLLREDNETDVSLEDRVAKAEAAKADMYVSIHQNAYDEDIDSVKGIETYYGETAGSIRLAELVHREAVERTGAVDREVQGTGNLYVLLNTTMPACLIETSFLSSSSDRGNIVKGEYQDRLAEGIAQGIHTYFNPKTMYLTFDDGPSADNTTAVLDILKERNIKATFFVVGENVRKHPDVARRIVEEGHTIGIHCNKHDYKQLYESVDSYLEDFQKAYDAVYEITGAEAKLFRFPGGSVNDYNKAVGAQIIQKMTEKGYVYFDWNASLEDAVSKSDPETLVQNAVSSARGRETVILLAHDVIYNTTQCLEKIIDSFPEYEMRPLTAEVEPIRF